MKLLDLVGYQLVAINETEIKVKKDNTVYVLKIHQDHGDCCGYNEVATTLFISDEELSRNPVITAVGKNRVPHDEYYDSETISLVFFGEDKEIATVNSLSSSGSGYPYGACVTVECELLEIDEVLSEW